MRVLFAVPIVLAFGCAHEQTTVEPQPTAETVAPAPQPISQNQIGCAPVRVSFAFDSSVISESDKPKLTEAAACLKNNQRLQVFVEGHADDRGTPEYNQQLGEERAAAVASFLESQGVSSDQLKTVSYGEGKPMCADQDEDCWSKNRRAAIRPACRL